MDVVRRVHQMREISREARGTGRKIAFVPTMGALHDGHLSLVREARQFAKAPLKHKAGAKGDIVVVSVFVNPTQFGPTEDFETYPRDIATDADLCIQEGVDYLFCPEPEGMFPEGYRTFVDVEGLGSVLEGASRPGFFRGVCTVVSKLFHIVRPHRAYFGQKDAQQALIMRRMVRDLNLDVDLVIAPTLRHDDGVAMSSRNARLNPAERVAATALYRALDRGRSMIAAEGVQESQRVESVVREILVAEERVRVDYVAVADAETLERPSRVPGECLIAVAAWVGETRLIDNVMVKNPENPA